MAKFFPAGPKGSIKAQFSSVKANPVFTKKAQPVGRAQPQQDQYECEICGSIRASLALAENCERACKLKQQRNKAGAPAAFKTFTQKPAAVPPGKKIPAAVPGAQKGGTVSKGAQKGSAAVASAQKAFVSAAAGQKPGAAVAGAQKVSYSCEICGKSSPVVAVAEQCEKRCKAAKGSGKGGNLSGEAKTGNAKAGKGGKVGGEVYGKGRPQWASTEKGKGGDKASTSKPQPKTAATVEQSQYVCEKCGQTFVTLFAAEAHERNCKVGSPGKGKPNAPAGKGQGKGGVPAVAGVKQTIFKPTPKSFPLKATAKVAAAPKGSFNAPKGAGKGNQKGFQKGGGPKYTVAGASASSNKGASAKVYGGGGGGGGAFVCKKCGKSFNNKFLADGHERACRG